MGEHLESTSFSSTAPIKTKAGTWQKPGTPSLSSLGLAGHSRAPQLSPCVLWSQTHPSSESGGQNKTKKKGRNLWGCVAFTDQLPTKLCKWPTKDRLRHQGCFRGVFPLILSPMHLSCCCLLLLQTHFSAHRTDFRTTFDKRRPWQLGDKYYFPNLPSFVSHLQVQPATRWKQLINFPRASQEFFLVFFHLGCVLPSPWTVKRPSGRARFGTASLARFRQPPC